MGPLHHFLLPLVLLLSSPALALRGPLATQTFPNLVPRESTPTATSSPSTTPIIFITTQHITIDGVTNAYVTIPAKTIDISLPTCSQTIIPDKNGYVPPGTCNALYNYYPSFIAAVTASCMFGVLLVAHTAQAIVYKKACALIAIYKGRKSVLTN